MTDASQPDHTPEKEESIKGVQDYFEDYSESIKNTPEVDNISELERHEYFSGELKDLTKWIQHEEFRIKKEDRKAEREDRKAELELKVNDRRSERELREKNAKSVFLLTVCWAAFIGAVILLKGFGKHFSYELTQAEFIFVIGSLTTSIFAFYVLVLRYLFQQKEDDGRGGKGYEKNDPDRF